MSADVDLSNEDHPVCRETFLDALADVSPGEVLEVTSDHDPEPVLHEYQTEADVTLDWEYRSEGPDTWKLTVSKVTAGDDGEEIDVRDIPPQKRHGLLLETYEALDVGASYVLVNDHDPKPLFYEFNSLHGDTFDWEYLRKDNDEYRVRITKYEESESFPDDVSTRVDVRIIPPSDRHAAIFHRFDLLADGDAMEIVADHDPEPLYHQLKNSHGAESIGWEYRQQDPNEVRVLLRKEGSSEVETPTKGDSDTGVRGEDTDELPEVDVREYPPQKRHDMVFDRYQKLGSGEAFVLVNDHDPKPLYFQMQEEMDGDVEWDYRRQDEGEWKVRIGKL